MTICSKLEDKPRLVLQGCRAKNVEGTKDKSSEDFVPGPKKQAFCKIHNIKRFGKCSNMRCTKYACVTAHIRLSGDKNVYVTPLCSSCNNHNNKKWFPLETYARVIKLIRVRTVFLNNPVVNKSVDHILKEKNL